jgi:hypothetical protein
MNPKIKIRKILNAGSFVQKFTFIRFILNEVCIENINFASLVPLIKRVKPGEFIV